MATRVTPIKKKKQPADGGSAENAVHYYREGIDTKPRPTGSLLTAFARFGGVSKLFCQTFQAADYDDFVARVARLGLAGVECQYAKPGDTRPFDEAPALRIADGDASPLIWRRHALGDHRYAVISEISGFEDEGVEQGLMNWIVAPHRPWDALVFPTKSVKYAAEHQFDVLSSYFAEKFGTAPDLSAQRVVIPPGVYADAYKKTDETEAFRIGVRRRLGIGDEDYCVLSTGHFSFYQRMHPTPLFVALEMAARRTGVRIHLIMAGWFDTSKIERTYRDLARDLSPAVNVLFLDGRDDEIRRGAWYAADTYAAFHDGIGSSIDHEVLEAMAAGLPVVAADWGANGDFVDNDVEGYLVQTWLPVADSGSDLSLAPERALRPEDDARARSILAGTVSQMTALDTRAAAEAFEILARDQDRRHALGNNAQRRISDTCDWPVVVRRHQALWADLRRSRPDGDYSGSTTYHLPKYDDPFRTYGMYASHEIDADTTVSLMPGLKNGEGVPQRLARVRANPLNDIASGLLLSPNDMDTLLGLLADTDHVDVSELAAVLSEKEWYRVPRTLGWLAKMGIVVLSVDAIAKGQKSHGTSKVDLGLAARRQGDDVDAQAYFEDVLHDDPVDLISHVQLGEIMAEAQDLDGAIDHFETAIDLSPDSFQAWLDMGKAKIIKGDHVNGIAALENAVQLSPQNAEAMFSLGAAHRRIGGAEQAVVCLEKAVRINPRHLGALLHLGHARKSMGRRAEALQAFRDALRIAPNSLIAKSGELSLGVERRGRENVERDATARRVALHVDQASSFRAFSEVFTRLSEEHWPLMSADGRDLIEFEPDVIVSGGVQTAQLRALAPNAMIVSAPAFLSSLNRCDTAFDGANVVAAPSDLIAQSWVALDLITEDRVHVVGYPGVDQVFRGDVLSVPTEMRLPGAYVLYAPSGAPDLGTGEYFDQALVEAICELREDLTLIVKPHANALQTPAPWLHSLAELAEASAHLQVVMDAEADALPYVTNADIVVTDVSSIMFDALAADRPLVLLRHPQSINSTSYDAQGIEWRWRDFAVDVASIELLPDAIDAALGAGIPDTETWAQYKTAVFDRDPTRTAAERLIELIAELST